MIKNVSLASVIFVFSASETNNEVTMDDVVENHVTDPLSSDIFPNSVDSEFSMSSSCLLIIREDSCCIYKVKRE